nr:MAG TPA: hypothetical protein [Caudoviricetes sp.]
MLSFILANSLNHLWSKKALVHRRDISAMSMN